MFYFAYGSNMSIRRLGQRVPSATFVTSAALRSHTLKFHKPSIDGSSKCDACVTEDPDAMLFGVVFAINETEKADLDAYEGLGFGYAQKWVEVATTKRTNLQVFTYCALQTGSVAPPYDWYRAHVLIGATEHGLPEQHLQTICAVPTQPDADSQRRTREMGIYHRAHPDFR